MQDLLRAARLIKALADVRAQGRAEGPPLGTNRLGGAWDKSIPGDQHHDYSHLLPEAHRNDLRLIVRTPHNPQSEQHGMPWAPAPYITASVFHKDNNRVPLGQVLVALNKQGKPGLVQPHSHLAVRLRGRGIGMAMYEAALAHAKNYQGATRASGAGSRDAWGVHVKLATKHGMGRQTAEGLDLGNGTEYHGGYDYRLK